jgi:hypothetical protein
MEVYPYFDLTELESERVWSKEILNLLQSSNENHTNALSFCENDIPDIV